MGSVRDKIYELALKRADRDLAGAILDYLDASHEKRPSPERGETEKPWDAERRLAHEIVEGWVADFGECDQGSLDSLEHRIAHTMANNRAMKREPAPQTIDEMFEAINALGAEQDFFLSRTGSRITIDYGYGEEPPAADGQGEWSGDKPLPEDEAISAAHPVKTGNHALYAEAMRLVGAKHSKGALVELANWLLVRIAAEVAKNEDFFRGWEDRGKTIGAMCKVLLAPSIARGCEILEADPVYLCEMTMEKLAAAEARIAELEERLEGFADLATRD